MPAMSGQNWRNSPPATAPHTDVMPPNTEPTRKRMEFADRNVDKQLGELIGIAGAPGPLGMAQYPMAIETLTWTRYRKCRRCRSPVPPCILSYGLDVLLASESRRANGSRPFLRESA